MRTVNDTNRLAETIERARLALRIEVCRNCHRRAPGSESSGADARRGCEPGCALFESLPRLVQVARCIDPSLSSPDHAVLSAVNEICARNARAGVPAAGGGVCPLSRYRRRISRVIASAVPR
jgi:hypothetical protein